MHTPRLIPVAAATAIAGLLAACGSSGSSGSTKTSSTHPATTSAPAAAPMLITTKHTKLGTTLGAGPKKLTVYLFEGDKGAASSCTGACAAAWPPVTGTPKAAGAVTPAALGTISRAGETTQVTYNGHPLYFFIKDIKDGDAGDTYGQAVKAFGAEWYALAPSGKKIDNS